MKRGLSIGALCLAVVALLVGGLFVVPTLMLKSGIDDLIARLPPGETFTYAQADYSVFTHTVTLKNAVLRFQPSGLAIDIDAVRVQDGNIHLRKAIDAATSSPDLGDAAETAIAGRVVVENVHSAMSPIDVHLARAEIDNLSVSLRQLMAPLPPLAKPSGSPKSDAMLQQAGLAITASRYDHLSFDDAVVTGTDEDGETATVRIASLTIDKFDHGDAGDTHLDGLGIGAGGVDLTVDRILAGTADHRGFWTALRDGVPVDLATEKFEGASQTIEGVKLVNQGKQVATLDRMSFSGLGYRNGALTALKLGVTGLVLDPTSIPLAGAALLPALGYAEVRLDGTLAYDWNQAGQTIRFDPVTLVMDQGGSLSVAATFAGAAATTRVQAIKLAGLTARYEDNSLVPKWLAYQAKLAGRTPEQEQTYLAAWLEQQKPAFRNDAPLSAAFTGIEAFIRNPHTLIVSLSPATPVGLADFDSRHPQDFTGRLGLSVTAQ